MTRKRKEPSIADELLDELLSGTDALQAFESGDLVQDLKKALAERILNAEMDHHLDADEEQNSGNHRNGHSRKQVLTDDGKMEVAVPRDRQGRFDPKLIEKHCRRLPGFDDKVISMYARGMSTREICAHVRELYGVEVSPELISKVTDAVLEELKEWQSRPLESVYAIVYFVSAKRTPSSAERSWQSMLPGFGAKETACWEASEVMKSGNRYLMILKAAARVQQHFAANGVYQHRTSGRSIVSVRIKGAAWRLPRCRWSRPPVR